uniref:Ig-like domain-containing protein n=1 Tax=Strigamia maritima TaxID=126957 RepID=T1JC07_STRMM
MIPGLYSVVALKDKKARLARIQGSLSYLCWPLQFGWEKLHVDINENFVLNASNVQFSTHQDEVLSSPGEAVNLECEIPNYKSDSIIRWLLNGETVLLPNEEPRESKNEVEKSRRRPFFNATHGIHVLHIAHVGIEDDGVWHCQEIPENQELLTFTSQPIRLIVVVAPQTPYIVFEDRRLVDGTIFTIREKNTVTFSCVVRDANPAPSRIEWLLSNGHNLTSSSHLQEEFLETERLYHSRSDVTFEVNRKHHQVLLHCHVHHITFSTSVTVSISFNILYTPSFVISRTPGFGYPITEGIAVSLKCEVDANPSSIPQWVKDDAPLSTHVESGGGYLNFSSITKEHAGWYRCSTYHEFGHFASFGYFLNVRYACKTTTSTTSFNDNESSDTSPCYMQTDIPEITDQPPPPQIQIGLGSAVMLECASEEDVFQSYCWAKVKEGGGLENVASEHNLRFDHVLYNDAGVYKCMTRNRIEDNLSTRNVEVVVTGKPFVEPLNQTLIAIVGKSVSITVQYCANPIPLRAYWIVQSLVLKPGETSERFSARNITKYSDNINCYKTILDILEVKEEDSGEFVFLVKNSYGIDDGVVWLNITQASFSVSLGQSISHTGSLHLLCFLTSWIYLLQVIPR